MQLSEQLSHAPLDNKYPVLQDVHSDEVQIWHVAGQVIHKVPER
jgi:hypothetical protein